MSVHHNQCPWPGSHFGPKCCVACPKMGAFSHFFDAFPISVVQLLTDIIQQLISAAVDFYFSNFRMTEWWWEGMRGEEEKERGGRLSSESWRGKEEKKEQRQKLDHLKRKHFYHSQEWETGGSSLPFQKTSSLTLCSFRCTRRQAEPQVRLQAFIQGQEPSSPA